MVEGDSGILAVYPSNQRPTWNPSKRRITWRNGAIATTYTSYEPDALRGPQFDGAWCDELASWKYPQQTWDNLMLGLRLRDPRCCVTTTPKPIKLLKELLARSNTVVTCGSTYENIKNLAPAFAEQIIRQYEGTRLGRQEIHAEMLEDDPNALWRRKDIDDHRMTKHPELVRIVVAVDPAATSGETSDETGIVVAGLGVDKEGYVLDDASLRASPHGWGSAAVASYNKHRADRIVGEVNNGGEMVEHVIRTVEPTASYKAVHASRDKRTRAEPVAALYEQGRVHHVGTFADLEDQLCQWVPGESRSPDRLDALVWALTELGLAAAVPKVRWL